MEEYWDEPTGLMIESDSYVSTFGWVNESLISTSLWGVPAGITDLVAGNPTDHSITLNWTAPGNHDFTGNASGYVVKYSTTGPINSTNWGSATKYPQSWVPAKNGTLESHVVSGLSLSTTYYFAVEANNSESLYGAVSNSPSATTTPDTTPPATITDLTAINSNATSITLKWTAPGNDGMSGNATGYVVKYSTSGAITNTATWGSATTYNQGWIPVKNGTTEKHSVTGLSSDVTYWFAIEAFDNAIPPNYSGFSNSPSAKTLDDIPPATISDLATVSATNTSITLTWIAPGNDGMVGNATGYIVKYSTTGAISGSNWNLATNYTHSWTPLPAGSIEMHVISGLSPDTKYWFAIEAFDAVPNYSNVSNSPSGRTLDLIPPATITDLAAGTPTANSITLTWAAPGDDGMSGNASGYVIRYSTAGPITSANWASATAYAQSWIPAKNGTEEIHVVSGLASGTTYWFAVEAYDKAGNYGAISTISPSATTLASTTPLGGIHINASNVDAILFLAVMVAAIAGGLGVYRRRWKSRWTAAKSQGGFDDL
jgi:hypothetical protein